MFHIEVTIWSSLSALDETKISSNLYYYELMSPLLLILRAFTSIHQNSEIN
jgi:hypothetical protein